MAVHCRFHEDSQHIIVPLPEPSRFLSLPQMLDVGPEQLDDVCIVHGTPTEPVTTPAVILRLWSRPTPDGPQIMASMAVIRPDRAGYLVNPVTHATDTDLRTALDNAIALARARKLETILVNPDLDGVPGSN